MIFEAIERKGFLIRSDGGTIHIRQGCTDHAHFAATLQ